MPSMRLLNGSMAETCVVLMKRDWPSNHETLCDKSATAVATDTPYRNVKEGDPLCGLHRSHQRKHEFIFGERKRIAWEAANQLSKEAEATVVVKDGKHYIQVLADWVAVGRSAAQKVDPLIQHSVNRLSWWELSTVWNANKGGWDIVLRIDGTYFGDDPDAISGVVQWHAEQLKCPVYVSQHPTPSPPPSPSPAPPAASPPAP